MLRLHLRASAHVVRQIIGAELDERATAVLDRKDQTDVSIEAASEIAAREPFDVPDATGLRVDAATKAFVFDVDGTEHRLPVADIAYFQIDGGPKRWLNPNELVDGPVR